MSTADFIIAAFCFIDDAIKSLNWDPRTRGPGPLLTDAEVITMEIVGEYLGMDNDKAIWSYFKECWPHFFS